MYYFKTDPAIEMNDYVAMVIENLSIDDLTTEQKARELTILSLTLLTASPKVAKTLASNAP